MICVHTITNLFKSLCILHKANILLLCYTILSILEFSILFSMLCNYMIDIIHLSYLVTCITSHYTLCQVK